jgi:hypothetical protein
MLKILNVSFIMALMTLLTGCELLKFDNYTTKLESNNINYTELYLSLTALSDEQISESIHQHQLMSQVNKDPNIKEIVGNTSPITWHLKSVLFFALPNSPVHNPFTAKSKLNQLSLDNLKETHLTSADFAFFSMLRTQLNQQILLLNALSAEKKTLQGMKQTYQIKSSKLQQQLQALQQQIIQLKKIESNINEHGQ